MTACERAFRDVAAAEQKLESSVDQLSGTVKNFQAQIAASQSRILRATRNAQANQLPGGNATGANVQNGAYVLRIAGTG